MSLGTIYYIIPDVFGVHFDLRTLLRKVRRGGALKYLRHCVYGNHRAIGGHKIHYQHVILLREAGYDAKILQLGKFSGNFFGFEVPIVHLGDLGYQLHSKDVVVATEFMPYDGLSFENCRRVMFVQNTPNFRRRLRPEDRGLSYHDLGYDHIITCSDFVSARLHDEMGVPAFTITNGVDQEVFFSDPALRIKNRVLCLPRKHASDIEHIIRCVVDQFAEVEFVKVDGLTQEEIAVEYRKSDVFLATGYPEGFGLPSLEALLSGAVVVGFDGGGGNEFLRHRKTALVAQDGDCEAAAACLLEVLRSEALKESLRTAGMEIAKCYSLDAMREKLLEFYRSVEPGVSPD
jgi:glycosyltransferase involved in cell wall biosynthesis